MRVKGIGIYRIREWWYFLGLPLLGSLAGKGETKNLIAVLTLSFFLGCYSFSLNEIFDKNLSRKFFAYPLLSLFPLIVSFFIFPLTSSQKIIIMALSIFASIYSLPFLRLKSIPFMGTLTNSSGFPLLIVLGAQQINREILLLYFLYFFLMLLAQLIHEFAHLKEDKRQGITTAMLMGKKSTRFLWLFLLPALLLSYFISMVLFLLILLLCVQVMYLISKGPNFLRLRKVYRWENLGIGIYLLLHYSLSIC
ncbi:MAG: UbiA family prenyltransferase [Caldiserica bacterium]|nr:UbiA family prenyltransferase [Caldisericota bacterium]